MSCLKKASFVVFLMLLQQIFLYARETNSNEMIHFQKLPKAELHLHLGGAYPEKYLLVIALPEQRELLKRTLDKVALGVDYHDVFEVFNIVNQIIDSEQKVE